MILHDISIAISPDMAVYKNRDEKRPRFINTRDFSGGSVYETRLDFDLHTGTHLDLPLHVFPDGAGSESWSRDSSFTKCVVFDFSRLERRAISAEDFIAKLKEFSAVGPLATMAQSVLLKTANSEQNEFDSNFTYLEKSGAEFLAGTDILGVGIDARGIERDQPGHDTHRALLGSGIWILEGLRLGAVPQGLYILALMPLKIVGVEAIPARAFLLERESMELD